MYKVIDAFILPIAAVLSFFFLKQRYSYCQVMAVCGCIFGCVCIIVADCLVKGMTGEHRLLGDALCLASSVLYAISNVGTEYFVRENSKVEYLAMIGSFASLISIAQM